MDMDIAYFEKCLCFLSIKSVGSNVVCAFIIQCSVDKKSHTLATSLGEQMSGASFLSGVSGRVICSGT